jgi:two-component system response regulator (stage 0 sporulation protein F)
MLSQNPLSPSYDPAPHARTHFQRLLLRIRPRQILLVEDHDELRALLATALRRDGYVVVECSNGDDALDWLGPGVLEGDLEQMPAAIISDVRLPYFTGLDILAGVNYGRERIPIILITAFPDEETTALASRLGARCVLAKPFPLDDLRRALLSALGPPERP